MSSFNKHLPAHKLSEYIYIYINNIYKFTVPATLDPYNLFHGMHTSGVKIRTAF